jgi:hypothetical protein
MPIKIEKAELRAAAAAFGEAIGGIFKGALTKSLNAAADAALEEIEGRIQEAGDHVGKVRRRARRAREAPIDVESERGRSRRPRRA